jgi:quercetin dioxygenase-like cupin family protein
MTQPKVVLKAAEALSGAPMERNPGVRDRKLVYPETGFPTRSLIMGIVEVDPGCRAPAHRHNCQEVYYVLDGRGEVVSDGVPRAFEAGDAVYNAPNSVHAVRNTGGERLRLLVVGGIMFVGLVPRWPTESPTRSSTTANTLAETVCPGLFCAFASGMRMAEPEASHLFREVTR